MSCFSRLSLSGLALVRVAAFGTALSMVSVPVLAQVAVDIPQDQLDAALASCGTAADCEDALAALIAAILAANPSLSPLDVIRSVAAVVAAASNAGSIDPAVAGNALAAASSAAASAGDTALATVLSGLASDASAGGEIDLTAIASGSGGGTPGAGSASEN